MRYLIDSDWIVSFLNGRRKAVELLESVLSDGVAVSAISWGEVLEGTQDYPDGDARIAQLEAFSRTFDIISVDVQVAHQYASIRRVLRTDGRLIPDNDLWIAATALSRQLTLVSRDQHFDRVPGLSHLSPK